MQAVVFCDITDPWSYLGAVRFERAAATFSILTGEAVEIAHMAAQVQRPGAVDDAVSAARISGIDLNVDDIVPAVTDDAWRLLSWARESGPAVQRDLIHQLWRAHFLEGADVADPFTLATRAGLVGLDVETADALLSSSEYGELVAEQRELFAGFGSDELPFIVIDRVSTIGGGLQAQDAYIDALSEIARARPERE